MQYTNKTIFVAITIPTHEFVILIITTDNGSLTITPLKKTTNCVSNFPIPFATLENTALNNIREPKTPKDTAVI